MQFANVWERVADTVGDEIALINGDKKLSWSSFDTKAAKIATILEEYGLTSDSKVGIYLHNSNEYLEAQYGVFKIEGVPINVNYRYKENELIYLLDNSDAEAVFFQGCYVDRIKAIKDQLPKIKVYIQIDDGTEPLMQGAIDYETSISSSKEQKRFDRTDQNIYMLYTGGTTGMPKGVMYKHGSFIPSMLKTAFAMGFEVPEDISDLEKIVKQAKENDNLSVSMPACPLMHGTGMWLGAFLPMFSGGSVVTISDLGLNPKNVWREVEKHNVNSLVIVGDAFAKPLLDELREAKEKDNFYDISSLRAMISSGVMWSSEIKDGLLEIHDMTLYDAMGSSEGGMGSSVSNRETPAKTAKFSLNPGVIVLSDDGNEVEPGSDVMGKIGTSGLVPEGYFKDEKKSAETFKEVNGVRYSFPGDYATINADGTINLLGRGSNCINTAGEKVYPEEVEEAVKKHPEVYDCLVVGLKDEKFGQRVVALASLESKGVLDEGELIDFTREQLSGYKLPKQVLFVEEVMRAPNGKANYKWAKEEAEKNLG
jgi:fatty-acyl-CoA synthase